MKVIKKEVINEPQTSSVGDYQTLYLKAEANKEFQELSQNYQIYYNGLHKIGQTESQISDNHQQICSIKKEQFGDDGMPDDETQETCSQLSEKYQACKRRRENSVDDEGDDQIEKRESHLSNNQTFKIKEEKFDDEGDDQLERIDSQLSNNQTFKITDKKFGHRDDDECDDQIKGIKSQLSVKKKNSVKEELFEDDGYDDQTVGKALHSSENDPTKNSAKELCKDDDTEEDGYQIFFLKEEDETDLLMSPQSKQEDEKGTQGSNATAICSDRQIGQTVPDYNYAETWKESHAEREKESHAETEKESHAETEDDNDAEMESDNDAETEEDDRAEMEEDNDAETDDEVIGKTSKRRAFKLDELETDSSDEDDASNSEVSDSESEMDESEIIRDSDMKDIFVTKVTKSTTTKHGRKKRSNRVYNGRNSCPFCSRLTSNFSTHIFNHWHEQEPQVRKIRKTKEGKERKRLIRLLRNRGNNIHNCTVLKKKKGQILLSRRIGTEEATFSCKDYGPCPSCFEWLRKTIIPRHNKSCPGRNKDNSKAASATPNAKGALLVQSNIISGRVSASASQLLIKEVFPIMTIDKVSLLAQKDPLIITLGNLYMGKNVENKLMLKYYTSCVIRLASRLLLQLQALVTPTTGTNLENYLCPKHFDDVARAVVLMCIPDADDEKNLQASPNAIKLAAHVRKLCVIKRAHAIKNEDVAQRKEAKRFLELMDTRWDTKLQRLLSAERKFHQHEPLPLLTDIEKLNVHLIVAAERADLEDASYENFKTNVIIALSSCILYNRRRPGDVQSLTLDDYRRRKSGLDDVTQEAMVEDVTQFERHLLESQDVITIRAKGNKYLPLLIQEHIRPILKYLASDQIRRKAGVLSSNNYLFSNNGIGVIRGGYAVEQMVEESKLKHPERIRAGNCRKYMATVIQGLNTTSQEQHWIVDHLGHTLDVHKIRYQYRQTSALLERTDIVKVLLMLDNNKMREYKGRRILDIRIEELMEKVEQQKQDPDQEQEQPGSSADILAQGLVADGEPEDEDYHPDENDHSCVKTRKSMNQRRKGGGAGHKRMEIEDENNFPDEFEDEDDDDLLCVKTKSKKQRRTVGARHKWTAEELEEVQKLFVDCFKHNKTPGEVAVRSAMALSEKNGGLIWRLPLKNIKSKVSWMRLHPK